MNHEPDSVNVYPAHSGVQDSSHIIIHSRSVRDPWWAEEQEESEKRSNMLASAFVLCAAAVCLALLAYGIWLLCGVRG